ncbi:hypothetical protein ALC60_14570, partial [Trachymyrmex zeteki]
YRCLNKLNSFIKVHKDRVNKTSNQNVVYKINCFADFRVCVDDPDLVVLQADQASCETSMVRDQKQINGEEIEVGSSSCGYVVVVDFPRERKSWNGYPLEFVFSSIKKRIKFHIDSNNGTVDKKVKEKIFTIPYVNSVPEKFTPIANRFHCKLIFSISNSLWNFIRKGKDQLDPLCNQNVVYKISCDDCDVSYVGQIKRQLKIRLHEHVSDINKKSKSPTVITNHRIDQNHNFDWGNVEILDIEASYNKGLISGDSQ